MPATDSLQTRKLCSAYGGVGSIIESRLGALRILSASEWPYVATRRVNRPENRLNDDRLLARLRCLFPDLRRLARMPYNPPLAYAGAPSSPRVATDYFPKWMYCPSCSRFDHYASWRRQWHLTLNAKPAADKEKFEEAPRCDYCYHKQQQGSTARWQTLEQVRFVMTSPAGALADVPWPQWALRHRRSASTATEAEPDNDKPLEEPEENGRVNLDMHTELPEGLELYYRTVGRLSDLKGIVIEARRRRPDGSSETLGRSTLAGLFGLRVLETEMEGYGADKPRRGVPMKPVLRASNSVYYPHIVQSLYLPGKQPTLHQEQSTQAPDGTWLTAEIAAKLKSYHAQQAPMAFLQMMLKAEYKLDVDVDELEALATNGFVVPKSTKPKPPLPEPSQPGEEDYRRAEYQYLVSEAASTEDPDLLARPLELSTVPGLGFGLRIDRLKMTAVQTSYTRQQPLDRDAYLSKDEAGNPMSIRRRYTTRYGLNTHTLLGVESYGEGLFFTLEETQLTDWEKKPAVRQRVKQLVENQGKLTSGSPGAARQATPRFVLLHTLAHLLIKELEFQCGYPATSLQERLYIGAGMQGLLIYTIAGSEGSYGGLVSLARTNKLPNLIQSALIRACDCAADPICWHTDEQGQGVGGLNLAACASCVLLPETSCEEFNSLLDRQLVVDTETSLGYFNDIMGDLL